MTDLLVRGIGTSGSLRGSVPVPADEEIALRALLLGALAKGKTALTLRDPSVNVTAFASTFEALGVTILRTEDGFAIDSAGLYGLAQYRKPLAIAHSETALGALIGVLSAQGFASLLVIEEEVLPKVGAALDALRARGASFSASPSEDPLDAIEGRKIALRIEGLREGTYLSEVEWASEPTDILLKEALLASGLHAHGATRLQETSLSIDHTPRMLQALEVQIRSFGTALELDPEGTDSPFAGFSMEIPGDAVAAAILASAALVVPGSNVTLRRVTANPFRTRFFDLLKSAGANISLTWVADSLGEPLADVSIVHHAAPLRALEIGDELARSLATQAHLVLAVATIRGEGARVLLDGQGESEREMWTNAAATLRRFGVDVEATSSEILVRGGNDVGARETFDATASKGSGTASAEESAVAALILALASSKHVRIVDGGILAGRFPRLFGTLRALGADVRLAST